MLVVRKVVAQQLVAHRIVYHILGDTDDRSARRGGPNDVGAGERATLDDPGPDVIEVVGARRLVSEPAEAPTESVPRHEAGRGAMALVGPDAITAVDRGGNMAEECNQPMRPRRAEETQRALVSFTAAAQRTRSLALGYRADPRSPLR